jgi:hypothetical protein
VGAYDAKLSAGKSYVIFGKTDTGAIDLSKLGDKSKYTIDYLGDKNDNSMALVLSFLPNTTYDLPAFDLLLESGPQICGVPVDDLSLGVA